MSYRFEEVNYALAANIGRPRRVLDVGCGIGQNGAVARARGAHVVGIDRSPTALAQAQQVLTEVYLADIETEQVLDVLSGQSFDLILFGDVLEHTAQPLTVLHRICTLLEAGGHVIISLPNIAAWTVRLQLLAGRFQYEPSGILDQTHLRFFTRSTAIELVEQAGLELLRMDLNPMLIRATRDLWLQHFMPEEFNEDPMALSRTRPYQVYRTLIRPVEGFISQAAPNLLAFQHVLVARKPPRLGPLSLTVGMLACNEEACVEQMIDEIRNVARDAKILIVDSSTDRTPALAEARGARVIRQQPARGHAPAMERLMYEAAQESEMLIYLDCDLTYPTQFIPYIRALLEAGADVVNTSRTQSRPQSMPLSNFVANRVFAGAARLVHGVPTQDVHSGMRGYRTSVIRAFDFDGRGDALPLDTLLLPARSGYRIVELPIPYGERCGVSKLARLRGTAWTFVRILRALATGDRVSLPKKSSKWQSLQGPQR